MISSISPPLYLGFSVAMACLYGVVFSWRIAGSGRLIGKGLAMLGLIFMAISAQAPTTLQLALIFAIVGDLLIVFGWTVTRFRLLHSCLAAYAAAYTLIIANFIDIGLAPGWAALVGVPIIGGTLVFYGREIFTVSVVTLGYATLVLVMAIVAMMLPEPYLAAKVGAWFILFSGLVFGVELFRIPPQALNRRMITSPTIWFTYYGGLVLIVLNVLAAGRG